LTSKQSLIFFHQKNKIGQSYSNYNQFILVVFAQDCDPGVCSGIPGLVYNSELDQCAWPDEVGCSLKGTTFSDTIWVTSIGLQSHP